MRYRRCYDVVTNETSTERGDCVGNNKRRTEGDAA